MLDNDPDGHVNVQVHWYDGTSFLTGFTSADSSDSSSWQQLTLTGLSPHADADGAKFAIFMYYETGWDGSATIYVDDALFDDDNSVPEFGRAFLPLIALSGGLVVTGVLIITRRAF